MISYIVSVYDRLDNLDILIPILNRQHSTREIHICENGPTDHGQRGPNVFFHRTGERGAKSCYDSAGMVYQKVKGDWLCFPSDDSLYVQDFNRIMLRTAEETGADLVYCDCVYKANVDSGCDPNWKQYSVLDVSPRMGRIDKTNFIVRASKFAGFPPHPRDFRDGALIESLVSGGIRHAKAPGVLCVHQ